MIVMAGMWARRPGHTGLHDGVPVLLAHQDRVSPLREDLHRRVIGVDLFDQRKQRLTCLTGTDRRDHPATSRAPSRTRYGTTRVWPAISGPARQPAISPTTTSSSCTPWTFPALAWRAPHRPPSRPSPCPATSSATPASPPRPSSRECGPPSGRQPARHPAIRGQAVRSQALGVLARHLPSSHSSWQAPVVSVSTCCCPAGATGTWAAVSWAARSPVIIRSEP